MIYRCLNVDTPDPAHLRLDGKYRAEFLDTETIWRYAHDPQNDLNEASVRRSLASAMSSSSRPCCKGNFPPSHGDRSRFASASWAAPPAGHTLWHWR